MKLTCRYCGESIAPDDINIDRLVAKCGACGAVFGFAGEVEDASAPAERAPVELPARMTMEDIGQAIEIRRRWFGPAAVGLLIFTIFWNGFMVVWHTIAISQGAWVMSLFGLLHTAVGIVTGYSALAMLFNTTTIRSGMGVLEVTHAPLPWPGAVSLRAEEIEQIYTRNRWMQSRHGGRYLYDLIAKLRDGSEKKLLAHLDTPEPALYIEQELERFLGIEDRPVAGEHDRRGAPPA